MRRKRRRGRRAKLYIVEVKVWVRGMIFRVMLKQLKVQNKGWWSGGTRGCLPRTVVVAVKNFIFYLAVFIAEGLETGGVDQ